MKEYIIRNGTCYTKPEEVEELGNTFGNNQTGFQLCTLEVQGVAFLAISGDT